MSDATLPPPRSSSLPPTIGGGNRSNSSSSEGDFDVTPDQPSSSASREESGGDSEGRADGKQKRKRTSPTDQAILEAEYKQNPKPNKVSRAEIVEKVSLNEKEVQIWFQNRRQINRRKSRPLLPHEIAAFGLGGIAALSSDPAPITALNGSENSEHQKQGALSEEHRSREEGQNDLTGGISTCPDASSAAEALEGKESNTSQAQSLPPSLKRQSSSTISLNEISSFQGPDSVIHSFTSTPGYLSNRWNPANSSFSTPASSSRDVDFVTPAISQTRQPASCPERLSEMSTSSSNVRLSMSLDGKAELVSTSPSPPHLASARPSSSESFIPQKRMRTLQRSQSALPFPSQPANPASEASYVPRLPTGRSRDARTWQFCCDGEAKDELTTQAERESNGSAVAALSLMRSTSNSALKSNSNKRNPPAQRQGASKQGKKPKLGRTQSSLARLQYQGKEYEQLTNYAKEGLMRSPSGDSDKENWLPGENTDNSRRRPLPSARTEKSSMPRTILGDNHNVPTHAVNFGGRSRKRKSADIGSGIFEDQENSTVPGEEVQKFMRGEVSPSKKGDLDCIQGLLSLSQGNWR